MIITAKFTGRDSLGYQSGKEYRLVIVKGKDYPIVIVRAATIATDGEGYCPYSNINSFLENWDNIKVLGKEVSK